MTLIFVLCGLLLVVSGILKIAGARRAGLGVPLLSLVEVVSGVALPVLGMSASASPETGFRLVQGAVGLVLVSTLSHGFKVRRRHLRRTESEGRRLVTYVKYLSRGDDPPPTDS